MESKKLKTTTKKIHTVLQKALGGKKFREQRFLLVSIETNSDQEGRGFLSSARFSEASSAHWRAGGKKKKATHTKKSKPLKNPLAA